MMEAKVGEALEKVADRVLERFKKDFLEPLVFKSHDANKFYRRTGDFENAWNWTAMKKQAMTLSKEMWYDPRLMEFDPNDFTHGSPWGGDARETLMDILNRSGYSSSSSLSVKRPAPYWDVFILAAFQGGLLDKIITEEFKKVGFIKS